MYALDGTFVCLQLAGHLAELVHLTSVLLLICSMVRADKCSSSSSSSGGVRQPLLAPGAAAEADVEDLEQGLPEAPQTSSVLRLLREARPEALTLSVASFFLLIGSLANLAVPKIAGELHAATALPVTPDD